MCATLQPPNLRGETNYHLQAASYSLVSPLKSRVDSLFPSVIILSADPPSSPSLRPLPSLSVIHFSSAVSPSFNRCHYWQDASSQNTNPSFDTVLKDYSDTWVCPGIKKALSIISMNNKAFPWMTSRKSQNIALTVYCLAKLPWTPHK